VWAVETGNRTRRFRLSRRSARRAECKDAEFIGRKEEVGTLIHSGCVDANVDRRRVSVME